MTRSWMASFITSSQYGSVRFPMVMRARLSSRGVAGRLDPVEKSTRSMPSLDAEAVQQRRQRPEAFALLDDEPRFLVRRHQRERAGSLVARRRMMRGVALERSHPRP